jgi:hypothetical protein
MNKKQQEMIEKAERVNLEVLREIEFDTVYILPQNKKHESGYKMMYVIGCKDNTEYLIATYSDVIDFNYFNPKAGDLHMDIEDNGIMRFWSNNYKIKVIYNSSCCMLEFIKKEKRYE